MHKMHFQYDVEVDERYGQLKKQQQLEALEDFHKVRCPDFSLFA